jgi:hypothetical protein
MVLQGQQARQVTLCLNRHKQQQSRHQFERAMVGTQAHQQEWVTPCKVVAQLEIAYSWLIASGHALRLMCTQTEGYVQQLLLGMSE